MAVNEIAEHPLTTHIVYHEEDNDGNSISRMVDLQTGNHSLVVQPQSVIRVCSSSKGMLLLQPPPITGWAGRYFLYNPFVGNLLKALPFYIHPHCPEDPCYSVVTLDGSTFDVVVLKSFQRNEAELYDAVVFSSDADRHFDIEFSRNCTVLPNSGVSCGRNVYFLTDAWSVLKIDVANLEPSDISMCINDISNGDIIAAQLGRKRNMLGLVIANKSKLWIKVYFHVQTGDIYNWTNCCSVNVELDPYCDDVSIIEDGGEGSVGRIRCKEMPTPVRFESFRLQVPLWVDGRIVMVEESVNGNVLLRRTDCQIPLNCATGGMSYVKSRTRLLFQIDS